MIFLEMLIDFQRWIICTSLLRFGESVSAQNPTMVRRLLLRIYRELYKSLFGISVHICKKPTSLLRICVFAQIIQSWKTLLSKITIWKFSAHVRKFFHVSIKIWRICQRTKSNSNCAQNTSTYIKGIIQIAINLGVPAHVRKKLPGLY